MQIFFHSYYTLASFDCKLANFHRAASSFCKLLHRKATTEEEEKKKQQQQQEQQQQQGTVWIFAIVVVVAGQICSTGCDQKTGLAPARVGQSLEVCEDEAVCMSRWRGVGGGGGGEGMHADVAGQL
ncbi:hypothetical protein T11_11661 [Trichinella zimbabwensis]|uniref:Uncharacterized protein n=1 Tax=Trichinella zimbabwensis TaxID=268475 RepID=A0A0V1HIY0_9BILA|nr:hypothetical protein T11_11661 [Trichinella zimbabwensis]